MRRCHAKSRNRENEKPNKDCRDIPPIDLRCHDTCYQRREPWNFVARGIDDVCEAPPSRPQPAADALNHPRDASGWLVVAAKARGLVEPQAVDPELLRPVAADGRRRIAGYSC